MDVLSIGFMLLYMLEVVEAGIPSSVGASNLGPHQVPWNPQRCPVLQLHEQGSSQAAAERQVALREPQLEFLLILLEVQD